MRLQVCEDLARAARSRALGTIVLVSALAGCVADVPEADHFCDGHGAHDEPSGDVGAAREALSSLSCDEREDTGYVRGDAFPIRVVTVDGKPVEVDTANAYYVMAQAAARDGVEIRVVSGFRTMAQQRYLYDCYRTCSCNSCNLAARPGYSNHQSGHALDLNTSVAGVRSWLDRNGARFGFSRTVPSEAWHWEWWGGGPGGGPCGRAEPPTVEACPPLPAAGGVIEETSGCFWAKGPSRTWRSVTTAGHGGSLLWTNAWQTSTPSNWARWYLRVREAGEYAVQIWAEPGYAVHRAARYRVAHDAGEARVELDLGAGSGWRELGTHRFGPAAVHHVSVYDDSPVAVPSEQRIPADAIRLVRVESGGGAPEPEGGTPPAEDAGVAAEAPDAGAAPEPEGPDTPGGGAVVETSTGEGALAGDGRLVGACAASGAPTGDALALIVALCVVLRRRGRRAG